MKTIELTAAYSRVALLALLRTPAYVVPTLAFPALFFVLFDLQYARQNALVAGATTLSFIVFAVTGVALFQFGIGIAQERGRPWERYLRTLPAPPWIRFAARIVAALVFGLLAAGIVALVARALTPIDLSLADWSRVLAYSVIGAVPFVLMGIVLGYWCSPRASIPIANLCNLVLAYAGGLWIPPQYLPEVVQRVSPWLPTRQFMNLLWSTLDRSSVVRDLAGLAIYTLLLFAVATIGYRRDEMKRYA